MENTYIAKESSLKPKKEDKRKVGLYEFFGIFLMCSLSLLYLSKKLEIQIFKKFYSQDRHLDDSKKGCPDALISTQYFVPSTVSGTAFPTHLPSAPNQPHFL